MRTFLLLVIFYLPTKANRSLTILRDHLEAQKFKSFHSGKRIRKFLDSQVGFTGCMWTKGVSGKKSFWIRKYPDTRQGRGLSLSWWEQGSFRFVNSNFQSLVRENKCQVTRITLYITTDVKQTVSLVVPYIKKFIVKLSPLHPESKESCHIFITATA